MINCFENDNFCNKKIKLLFLLGTAFFTPNVSKSNMAPEGFERFPNYYFVETGTFCGNGIRLALRARFSQIYSIEIDESFVYNARYQFSGFSNVHIVYGDSGKDLWNVIKDLDKPITFWLDGHRGIADPNGGKNTPVLEELEQIKQHPIKTHTIVIDDMHCCDTILFDYISREQLKKKLLEINPEYTVTYVNGGDEGQCKDNIMVAYVEAKIKEFDEIFN